MITRCETAKRLAGKQAKIVEALDVSLARGIDKVKHQACSKSAAPNSPRLRRDSSRARVPVIWDLESWFSRRRVSGTCVSVHRFVHCSHEEEKKKTDTGRDRPRRILVAALRETPERSIAILQGNPAPTWGCGTYRRRTRQLQTRTTDQASCSLYIYVWAHDYAHVTCRNGVIRDNRIAAVNGIRIIHSRAINVTR